MEEYVGKIWHRWVTRAATRDHLDAAVTLDEMRARIGILFRAFGGDGGLKVETAPKLPYATPRTALQRVAGVGGDAALAWRDQETLRLPERIARFPTAELNRDLYIWLAALAAGDTDAPELPLAWLERNQALTRRVLDAFPGLRPLYARLVEAHLTQRPTASELPLDAADQERMVRAALRNPGQHRDLPWATSPPFPVPLWLHPSPPLPRAAAADDREVPDPSAPGQSRDTETKRRRQAERAEMPDGKGGLIALRMESILTWAEHVNVDRSTEEDDDEDAERAADDMDTMAIARDAQASTRRLRFDLDLPSAEYDDRPLGEGITLPEWDFRNARLQPDHCRIQPMVAREVGATELPPHLRRTARRLRSQFQALARTRQWYRGQPDGSDVDLDAYLRMVTTRQAGAGTDDAGLYKELRQGDRDLACLLLADLSLSTDAAVNDNARVIDVIRDSLLLFAEALAATGDRFAMYGFSSRKRQHVRLNLLKGFDERYEGQARGRINAIRPGYYTRMGAAIRYTAAELGKEAAHRRLLLILTDGKPNDLDHYEGRYGVEDTRMAVLEARRLGLQPFCVTIDREAGEYLPHLFGPNGFVVIRHPEELPRRLPQLYARLTD